MEAVRMKWGRTSTVETNGEGRWHLMCSKSGWERLPVKGAEGEPTGDGERGGASDGDHTRGVAKTRKG